MGELGFFGTVIPEEYGGNDMGWLAAMILTEEIARASSSLRVQINMQALGCAYHHLPVRNRGAQAEIHPQTGQRRVRGRLRHHRTQCRLRRHGPEIDGRGQGRPLAPQRFQDLDLQCPRRRCPDLLRLHATGRPGQRSLGLRDRTQELQRDHHHRSGQDGVPLLPHRGDLPGGHQGPQGEHPGETRRRRQDRLRFPEPDPAFGGRRRRRPGPGLSGRRDVLLPASGSSSASPSASSR